MEATSKRARLSSLSLFAPASVAAPATNISKSDSPALSTPVAAHGRFAGVRGAMLMVLPSAGETAAAAAGRASTAISSTADEDMALLLCYELQR